MTQSHTFLAKLVHWTFIPLYAYGIFKQVDDISQLEDSALLVFESIFAAVFLLILILRFTYMRRFNKFQVATETPHRIHTFVSKSVHRGMYAALILLPLSGLIIAALYSQGIKSGPQKGLGSSKSGSYTTPRSQLCNLRLSSGGINGWRRLGREDVGSTRTPPFQHGHEHVQRTTAYASPAIPCPI